MNGIGRRAKGEGSEGLKWMKRKRQGLLSDIEVGIERNRLLNTLMRLKPETGGVELIDGPFPMNITILN